MGVELVEGWSEVGTGEVARGSHGSWARVSRHSVRRGRSAFLGRVDVRRMRWEGQERWEPGFLWWERKPWEGWGQ